MPHMLMVVEAKEGTQIVNEYPDFLLITKARLKAETTREFGRDGTPEAILGFYRIVFLRIP